MFYINEIAVLVIFYQHVASSDIQSQKFDIETNTRTVQIGESMETLKTISGVECAMICTNVNNCCSGTYEKGLEQCSLNLVCNNTKEQSEGSQTLTKTSKQEECLNGWISFSNHCYLFVYEKVTWKHAKVECQNKGGRLVKIDNNDEDSWLTSVLKDEVWMGMSDIQIEGYWIWDFDMSSLSFNQWHPGEPNGGGRENCGLYCKQRCKQSSFVWNDAVCSLVYGYVCEKPS
ncbi:unnamed protein product [Mytilus coruscus]|uniref:C-type lectin domain-containing protein n=1 Tax=Mytilus coruscus TaxID=42192 RepID=A0A6J8DY73_MYTCO|nr:unnamed protein product [Mytilus coruscus]